MSKSLSNAYLYINRSDYEVIGKKLFPGGNVENNVKSFCQDICVSDDFYEGLLQGPVLEDDVIRALLLLSLAAVESEVIRDKMVYGYSITIRGTDNPMDISEPCYIYVDGTPVMYVYQDYMETCTWKIMFMHPQACLDDDLVYAILKACEYR